MAQDDMEYEKRFEALENRIKSLEAGFSDITCKIESASRAGFPSPPLFGSGEGISVPPGTPPISEEAITWAGRASVLPRAATFSFLLVIALILRTVADSGFVDKLVGAVLGMGYAGALMIAAWFMYRKKSPEAPVFAVSGAVLLSTVVVETHSRFLTLPLVPAYLTLIAMGIFLMIMSRRFATYLPISAGVLGMCIAGAAMDYPNPSWPLVSLVLLAGDFLGFYASRLKSRSWLRWLVLIITIVMTGYWSFRLSVALAQGGSPPDNLYAAFFGPGVAALFAAFFALALVGILRGLETGIDIFDLATPSIAAVWAFAASSVVLGAAGADSWVLPAIGGGLAVLHFAIALWLAARGKGRTAGATSFSVAALLLLFMAIPREHLVFTWGLAVTALAGLGFALLSRAWVSGGMRIASYVAQVGSAFALAIAVLSRDASALGPWETIPAIIVAMAGIFQFGWCRGMIRAPASWGSEAKSGDKVVVGVLVGALSSLFMAGRIVLAQYVLPLLSSNQEAWFGCGQSVLINIAAIAVVVFAAARTDRELRNVALLIVIAGALKVFMVDLLNRHGMPLVASVLTFGIAAAIFSVVLGRWPRGDKPDGGSVAY